jgi:hypothetical protein
MSPDRNALGLAAAIAWLRRRLEQAAGGTASLRPAQASHALQAFEPTTAFAVLVGRLGLSPFEADLLMLGVAMELDTGIGRLCGLAQGDPSRPFPCFALGFALFEDANWEALSPARPLRHWRLLELPPNAQPLISAPLRAEERVVNHLKGLDHLDERLGVLLQPPTQATPDVPLPPSQQLALAGITAHWQRGTQAGPLQLVGADAASKRLLAQHAAAGAGQPLYRLAAQLLPTQPAEADALARLWRRETLLRPLTLLIEAPDADGVDAGLRRFLDQAGPGLLLAVGERLPRLDSAVVEVNRPSGADQLAAWQAALPGRSTLASRFAAQFDLDATTIHAIGTSLAGLDDAAAVQDCRTRLRPRLGGLAQVIIPAVGWDDIVLPPAQRALLRQLADQVPHRAQVHAAWGLDRPGARGGGLCALFAGESGTGKTMAAEILARELGLDLWRIDLSSVVSKYIGDTERNLRSLFDSAEESGAILFFDEADALFGRRSEVKDSHDRYANIEVNYLLQRMEGFRGIAILATNAKAALDTAFLRRLRFVLDFPYPNRADRARIWRQAFPAGLAAPATDWDRLGRLALTGGSIHTAALNAAFLAAQQGVPVGLAQMLAAARQELVKLDRPFNEADFVPPPGLEAAA